MDITKFKIKLNANEVGVMYGAVESKCIPNSNEMALKLLVCELLSIHRKMLTKFTYPKKNNLITLNAAEAIAFWIVFNKFDFNTADPFVMATMRRILDAIHKQYS